MDAQEDQGSILETVEENPNTIQDAARAASAGVAGAQAGELSERYLENSANAVYGLNQTNNSQTGIHIHV